MARKYGKKASEKVEKTMHEFKRGKLKSSSGQKVTSREQAIAIGLSQARRAGGKVPPTPSHAAMSTDARVRAYLSKMRPGQEIDAQGLARALGGIDPIAVDYALLRAEKLGLAVTQDWRWFGPAGKATRHHATKYQSKYGSEPGAWQSGFDYGAESAHHETRATARAVLGQLRAGARTDFDRGQVAGYEQVLGERRTTSHASKKKAPYIAYWVRSRGPGNVRDSVPVYVYGPTTRADEGIVGYDLRVRPLRLGKGTYTSVVSPDDVEDKP
jgi:uncharacterized protein DUF6496